MKIFCIGRNYADHAAEMGSSVPSEPMVFMKPATALLIKNRPFYYPDFSEDIHYEVELVLRICKNGKRIEPEFAHTYFTEVGLGIDFTARDIQSRCKEKGHPWEIAKAFDNSAAVSEFVPLSELPDSSRVRFSLEKNGEIVQRGDTNDLIFGFDQLISHISRYFKLQLGDLIFTGTPAGVGPVKVGDQLLGRLEGREILKCEIR